MQEGKKYRWFFLPLIFAIPFLICLIIGLNHYGDEIQRLLMVALKLVVIQ